MITFPEGSDHTEGYWNACLIQAQGENVCGCTNIQAEGETSAAVCQTGEDEMKVQVDRDR